MLSWAPNGAHERLTMPMAWTEHEKAASKKPAVRFVANRHIFLRHSVILVEKW
jgi:hypothetical protein